MSDLVSICIPVYNTIKYIEETVECFLNQTYKNIEIIIQDDCSTDGTWELICSLYSQNERVRLYRNKENLGIGTNWNEAYDKVKGKYVVIFNADDIVELNFIELGLHKLCCNKEIDLVSFKFNYLLEKNGDISPHLPQLKLEPGLQVDLINTVIKDVPFSWDFTIVKNASLARLVKNGRLFLNTQTCDFALWLEAGIKKLNLFYIDVPIGYYRKHSSNNSAIPLAEIKSFVNDVNKVYYPQLKTIKFYKTRIKNIRYALFKEAIKSRSVLALKLLLKLL